MIGNETKDQQGHPTSPAKSDNTISENEPSHLTKVDLSQSPSPRKIKPRRRGFILSENQTNAKTKNFFKLAEQTNGDEAIDEYLRSRRGRGRAGSSLELSTLKKSGSGGQGSFSALSLLKTPGLASYLSNSVGSGGGRSGKTGSGSSKVKITKSREKTIYKQLSFLEETVEGRLSLKAHHMDAYIEKLDEIGENGEIHNFYSSESSSDSDDDSYLQIIERLEYKEFLIHPEQGFSKTRNFILSVLVYYTILGTSFKLSFLEDGWSPYWDIFDNWIINLLFLIDLIFNFFTPIYLKNELVIDKRVIAGHYLRFWFWIDLISCLPLDLLYNQIASSEGSAGFLEASGAQEYQSGSSGMREGIQGQGIETELLVTKLPKMFRILRGLRLLRVFKIKRKDRTIFGKIKEYLKQKESLFLSILPFFVKNLMIVHFLACLWNMLGELQESNETWLDATGYRDEGLWERYWISYYFVYTTITTTGYGDVVPSTQLEFMFSIVLVLTGVVLQSFILKVMLTKVEVFVKKHKGYEKAKKYLKSLKEKKRLFSGLKGRRLYNILLTDMRTLYEQKRLQNSSCRLVSLKPERLGHLVKTKDLREINHELCEKVFRFRKVQFLRDRSDEFKLRFIANDVLKLVFLKDEMIYEKGAPSHFFYVIVKGQVQLMTHLTQEDVNMDVRRSRRREARKRTRRKGLVVGASSKRSTYRNKMNIRGGGRRRGGGRPDELNTSLDRNCKAREVGRRNQWDSRLLLSQDTLEYGETQSTQNLLLGSQNFIEEVKEEGEGELISRGDGWENNSREEKSSTQWNQKNDFYRIDKIVESSEDEKEQEDSSKVRPTHPNNNKKRRRGQQTQRHSDKFTTIIIEEEEDQTNHPSSRGMKTPKNDLRSINKGQPPKADSTDSSDSEDPESHLELIHTVQEYNKRIEAQRLADLNEPTKFEISEVLPLINQIEATSRRITEISNNRFFSTFRKIRSGSGGWYFEFPFFDVDSYFGEYELTRVMKRMYGARAVRRTTLYAIPKDSFKKLFYDESAYLENFVENLVSRYQNMASADEDMKRYVMNCVKKRKNLQENSKDKNWDKRDNSLQNKGNLTEDRVQASQRRKISEDVVERFRNPKIGKKSQKSPSGLSHRSKKMSRHQEDPSTLLSTDRVLVKRKIENHLSKVSLMRKIELQRMRWELSSKKKSTNKDEHSPSNNNITNQRISQFQGDSRSGSSTKALRGMVRGGFGKWKNSSKFSDKVMSVIPGRRRDRKRKKRTKISDFFV